MKLEPCKVVVLISGNGGNLQAIVDASSTSNYVVEAVISNKVEAYGLTRAKLANIETQVLDHKQFSSRIEFDLALRKLIDLYNPDLLVLAGFMRILSNDFVQHYAGRTLNIHPSLLPKFPGINTHQRAIEAGESKHGASVHFVTEELDGGPVIAHAKIDILAADSAIDLKSRVALKEHHLYPFIVDLFSRGRLKMHNGKAVLDSKILSSTGLDISEITP
ncbi:MAG: phosphoribosylglycinamide formyltransferase-1 [Pseudohongiellaceae bacterium]|jgi:phosphoribosylglycinamide formyltransferase-1